MAKQTITITLHTSELVYDVQNKTYLTGRSRSDGENNEAVADMQATDDAENANQVMRSIGNAIGALKANLGEYVSDSGTTASDVLFGGKDKVTVTLSMPGNFNVAVRDSLAAAMHQFVVNIAVGDWFLITDKADAEGYMTLAAANLVQIKDALNKRVRPSRPTAASAGADASEAM